MLAFNSETIDEMTPLRSVVPWVTQSIARSVVKLRVVIYFKRTDRQFTLFITKAQWMFALVMKIAPCVLIIRFSVD